MIKVDYTKEEIENLIKDDFLFSDRQYAEGIKDLFISLINKYGCISIADIFEYLYNDSHFGVFMNNDELRVSSIYKPEYEKEMCKIKDYICYMYMITKEDIDKISIARVNEHWSYKIKFPEFKLKKSV